MQESHVIVFEVTFNKKISMESNTFAGTSARRYRIVDAEERSHSILFNTISSFCGLKMININKANINMNYGEYKTKY
jgi:hypothetical protein